MHKEIKIRLFYNEDTPDSKILKEWKKYTTELCKPCWELHYCPYGPLVEEFPIMPSIKKDAKDHKEYLENCLKTGVMSSGEIVDKEKRKLFRKMIKEYDETDFPDEIPKVIKNASCNVYGHICPVFFTAEQLTETKELRRHSRNIPRDVMIKVIRRDGQVCQKCNQIVPDDEVEFDHIIPFSKGGTSTVENLRVVHFDCNRKKSNSLDEILHKNPIEHYFNMVKKN